MAPRNPLSRRTQTTWNSLQPAQSAYADDLAVASSSFGELMFALAPAFRSVNYIAGLNMHYRKCCLGSVWQLKEHDSL